MYAITDRGYRAIDSPNDLAPEESLVYTLPTELLLAIKKEEVRFERRRRLDASDWTLMPDTNLTTIKQAAWRTYRQRLRDISTLPNFPDIEWPEPPSTSEDEGDELPEQS